MKRPSLPMISFAHDSPQTQRASCSIWRKLRFSDTHVITIGLGIWGHCRDKVRSFSHSQAISLQPIFLSSISAGRQLAWNTAIPLVLFVWLSSAFWASLPLMGWGHYDYEPLGTCCTLDHSRGDRWGGTCSFKDHFHRDLDFKLLWEGCSSWKLNWNNVNFWGNPK